MLQWIIGSLGPRDICAAITFLEALEFSCVRPLSGLLADQVCSLSSKRFFFVISMFQRSCIPSQSLAAYPLMMSVPSGPSTSYQLVAQTL